MHCWTLVPTHSHKNFAFRQNKYIQNSDSQYDVDEKHQPGYSTDVASVGKMLIIICKVNWNMKKFR